MAVEPHVYVGLNWPIFRFPLAEGDRLATLLAGWHGSAGAEGLKSTKAFLEMSQDADHGLIWCERLVANMPKLGTTTTWQARAADLAEWAASDIGDLKASPGVLPRQSRRSPKNLRQMQKFQTLPKKRLWKPRRARSRL